MKAISTIIATIMLLLITVALIGVFYVFGSGLLSSSTASAGSSATATTNRMLQTIAVPIASCNSTRAINFAVQNLGTQNITAGGLAAYVDNNIVTTVPSMSSTGLNAGQQAMFAYVSTAGQHTLTIVGPSNSPIAYLTC